MKEYSTQDEFLQPIFEKGLEGMGEVFQNILNTAMRIERENYLKAEPYQRTEERTDYANGFKPRTLQTRFGKLDLSIPQTRKSEFYPDCLEKGLRSERAILTTM